jgi:flagellar assembly factor FliW
MNSDSSGNTKTDNMKITKLLTKRFGEIEVPEDKIIDIKNGIIGFPEASEYLFIEKDRNDPFKWLQSVQFGDLAFVLLDPFIFFPGYQVSLSKELADDLELDSIEQAIALVIVVIPKDLRDITANLLAPVILNPYKRIAKQVILSDNSYTTKHFLIPRKDENKEK